MIHLLSLKSKLMIKRTRATISKFIIHKVGNKFNSATNIFSENVITFDEESYELMKPYLLKPFGNVTESFRFNHHANIELNEINNYSSEIFKDDSTFIEISKHIVNHLFEQSNSAQIKIGDVAIALFEDIEYKDYWTKIPGAINNAKSPEDIINIDPLSGGAIFKFQRQQVVDAKKEADECDSAEEDADIGFSWPGGDPYEEMAGITIAYWYACLVKPFAPSPSALPALIPPPLTGIYIPIYYGGKKRLANNLRKAWNTGKTFSVLPVPQPPALAVSVAVAAAYALHLLEFKLLYLGGIPTPVGPVPMVGIVPVVF